MNDFSSANRIKCSTFVTQSYLALISPNPSLQKKRKLFFADFRSSTIQCRTQNSFHKRFLVFSSNTQLRTWHMRYQRHKKGPALSSTNMPSKLLRQRRQEDKDLFQKHICISKYYFIGNVHIAHPQNSEVILPDIFVNFLIK